MSYKTIFFPQEKGAAFQAGGLEVGQLILEVNGVKLEGKFKDFSPNFIFSIRTP